MLHDVLVLVAAAHFTLRIVVELYDAFSDHDDSANSMPTIGF